MVTSAYIHIPFCKSKCKYCSFISYTDISRTNEYIGALIKEIQYYYKGDNLKTLYLGGGTPSILSVKDLSKIIGLFKKTSDCEVTIEVNPDDITREYLYGLKEIGINRVSIGAQTFDDNILKIIGRRHDAKQVVETVKLARNAGFENISLDLIYGLPKQSIEILKNDLNIILNLGIKHVSTYGLKIEKGTPLYRYPKNSIPNDDEQADMYIMINDVLSKFDFYRYEVSNFSKPGFESRHNLNYWNNDEYYGFGVAAHGYVDGIRYSNITDICAYLKEPIKHFDEHKLNLVEKNEEEIFLGFRKFDGINTQKIYDKYGINFDSKYQNILNKYSPDYIQKTPQGYKLTLQGVLLSNIILSDFIE